MNGEQQMQHRRYARDLGETAVDLDHEGHAPALAGDRWRQPVEIATLPQQRVVLVHPRLQLLTPDQGLTQRLSLDVEDVEDRGPPVEAEKGGHVMRGVAERLRLSEEAPARQAVQRHRVETGLDTDRRPVGAPKAQPRTARSRRGASSTDSFGGPGPSQA